MSDTPRTDAVEVDFYKGTSCICHVPSVLARELELELAESKKKLARVTLALRDAISTYDDSREITIVSAERQEAWQAALNS
jgi:hypothetical protein